MIFIHFHKGIYFRDFLFAFTNTLFLPIYGQLFMVRILSRGANSFLSELTPIQKGGKNENGIVGSPGSVPIHLIIPSSFSFLFLLLFFFLQIRYLFNLEIFLKKESVDIDGSDPEQIAPLLHSDIELHYCLADCPSFREEPG